MADERRAKSAELAREQGMSMTEYREKMQSDKSSDEDGADLDFDGAKVRFCLLTDRASGSKLTQGSNSRYAITSQQREWHNWLRLAPEKRGWAAAVRSRGFATVTAGVDPLSRAQGQRRADLELSTCAGWVGVPQEFMSVNAAVQYRQSPDDSQELDDKKKRLFGGDEKKASVVLGKQMKDRITFDDVAGIGEAKLELMEVSTCGCVCVRRQRSAHRRVLTPSFGLPV